ncbi:hypothetical protein [Streptomyces galilaeus]|uniref:hypothetical protein n=1 Tax=Streptomyces galilaeus TaxID=33899 RepID=UPI00123E3519|nr:hypothetical protein [Streptomyces galilaeus]
MVEHRRLKLDARERQRRTGESYQTALNAVRGKSDSRTRQMQTQTDEGHQAALDVAHGGPDFRLAMVSARKAAVMGDTKAVEQFVSEWVTSLATPTWHEAVTSALMRDDVDDLSQPDQFRRLVRVERRQWTPEWRKQTRHGRVLALDAMVGDGLSLRDLAVVAADVDVPELATGSEFEDERLATIMGSLNPVERQVVVAYAVAGGGTWTEAAEASGALEPEVLGERVRRKVKRLAAEHQRRAALATRPVSPEGLK